MSFAEQITESFNTWELDTMKKDTWVSIYRHQMHSKWQDSDQK